MNDGSTIALKTAQKEVTAELVLSKFYCTGAVVISGQRVKLYATDGAIVRHRNKLPTLHS
jgi:hypothetical protein